MTYKFKKYRPVVHKTSFIHPLAAVTGNVIIGKHCYIGPGAALRGDWGQIVLEDGCIKAVTDEMIAWKTEGTRLYQQLPAELFNSWKPCEPLRKRKAGMDLPEKLYKSRKQVS